VTVAVATAEWRNARDAAFPAKPLWDGPLRGLRLVWTRSYKNDQTTLAQAEPEPPAETRRAHA